MEEQILGNQDLCRFFDKVAPCIQLPPSPRTDEGMELRDGVRG